MQPINITPFTVRCSQCGREASAIFRCPERKHGACPFVKRWTGHPSFGWLAAPALLGFAASAMMQVWWPLLSGVVVALLWWLIFTRTQLYNAASGTVLERGMLAGIQTGCKAMSKGERLPITLEPVQPVGYPFSILTLANQPAEVRNERDLAA